MGLDICDRTPVGTAIPVAVLIFRAVRLAVFQVTFQKRLRDDKSNDEVTIRALVGGGGPCVTKPKANRLGFFWAPGCAVREEGETTKINRLDYFRQCRHIRSVNRYREFRRGRCPHAGHSVRPPLEHDLLTCGHASCVHRATDVEQTLSFGCKNAAISMAGIQALRIPDWITQPRAGHHLGHALRSWKFCRHLPLEDAPNFRDTSRWLDWRCPQN